MFRAARVLASRQLSRAGSVAVARAVMKAPQAAVVAASRPTSVTASTLLGASRAMATITYSPATAAIGKPAPTFSAPAVVDGEIKKVSLSDFKGKYVILLFYPKDFTFVCPTEVIAFSDADKQFKKIDTQVIAISTDTEETHLAFIRTPRKRGGLGHMKIPIVADTTKSISADYGVLLEDLGIALRGLFIIDPQGILQQVTINNLPVGRNVEEAIRLVQAFQFVAEHGEVCPAGWQPGDKTMKPDPELSLEYFNSGATESSEEDVLAAGPKIVHVQNRRHFNELLSIYPKIVVDYVAPWCGKCKQIMPFVNELSEKHNDITFLKVDTSDDAVADLLGKEHVAALPAFHFYNHGKPALLPVTGYKKQQLKESVLRLANLPTPAH